MSETRTSLQEVKESILDLQKVAAEKHRAQVDSEGLAAVAALSITSCDSASCHAVQEAAVEEPAAGSEPVVGR